MAESFPGQFWFRRLYPVPYSNRLSPWLPFKTYSQQFYSTLFSQACCSRFTRSQSITSVSNSERRAPQECTCAKCASAIAFYFRGIRCLCLYNAFPLQNFVGAFLQENALMLNTSRFLYSIVKSQIDLDVPTTSNAQVLQTLHDVGLRRVN